VLICCETWEESRRLNSDWLLPIKLWLWRKRVANVDWDQEARKFVAYQADGSLTFPPTNAATQNKPVSAKRETVNWFGRFISRLSMS
jgi:hypothetical protein